MKIKFHSTLMKDPIEIEWDEAMALIHEDAGVLKRKPKEEPVAKVVRGVSHFDSADKSCYDHGCTKDCPIANQETT